MAGVSIGCVKGSTPYAEKESGELQEEGSEIKVQVFVIKPSKPVFEDLIARLGEEADVEVVHCSNALEIVKPVQASMASLIVCYGLASDEILQLLTTFKIIQREVTAGSARIAMLTPIRQTSLLSKFSFLGVSEIIPDPTAPRSLLFKVQRHIKALSAQLASTQRSPGGAGAGMGVGAGANEPDTDPTTGRKIRRRRRATETGSEEVLLTAPLEVDGDFWLLSDQRVKRVGGKWIVKLKGPSAGVGNWEAVRGAEECWTWRPHKTNDPDFGGLKGRWVFYGQKPDFEDDLWWFIGLRPQMTYEVEGESKGLKISRDEEGRLLLAKDSPVGAAFLPKIERSIRRAVKQAMEEGGDGARKKFRGEALADGEPRSGEGGEGSASLKRAKGVSDHETASSDEADFDLVPALGLKSDCWLLEEHKVRRINKQWMIKLTGPGPGAGRWTPAENAPAVEGIDSWQFEPHSDKGRKLLSGEKGSWVFYGRQPRFEGDGWVFVSNQPLLGFFSDGASLGNRIEWNEDDTIVLTIDSEQAKAKLPLIRQTWQNLLKEGKGEDADEFGKLKKLGEGEGREIRDLRQTEDYSSGGYDGTLAPDAEAGDQRATKGAAGSADLNGPGAEDPIPAPALPRTEWSKPALSPLGLVFLVAELAARKEAQSSQVAGKWMNYLATSCGGAVVELWLMNDGQADLWLSTIPDRDERRVKWVKSFAGQFKRDFDRGEALIPVKDENGKLIGLVVLAGPHISKLTEPYLKALEWSVRGVLSVNNPMNTAA